MHRCSRRFLLVAVFCGLFLVPASGGEAKFLPGLNRVGTDEGGIYAKGCMAGNEQVRSGVCRFGDPSSNRKVVLLGDSHAAHWGGALFRVARKNGWKVIVLTRASCPAAMVSIDKYCDIWRQNIFRRIKRIRPGLVLVASAANHQAYSVLRYGKKLSRSSSEYRLFAGMVRTFRFLKRWSKQTVLIRDQSVAPFDVTTCLREHKARPNRCGFRSRRSRTWSYDFKAARQSGVRVIDPQEFLCPDRWCHPLAGRYLIYRNTTHLAATFTRTKHNWLARKLGNPWPETPRQKPDQESDQGQEEAPGFPRPLVKTLWPGSTVQAASTPET